MIIGVLNQKGGVGKTTVAVNLAAALAEPAGARKPARVLLVSTDPQGSALDWAAARQAAEVFSVVGFSRANLHREIEEIGAGYQHIVIDGLPGMSQITRSSIIASDVVIIPMQPGQYDLWAVDAMVKLVEDARSLNENRKAFFVINRRVANSSLSRRVVEALDSYPFPVLESKLTQLVAFAEATTRGMTIYEMGRKGKAAAEMTALKNEIITEINKCKRKNPQ